MPDVTREIGLRRFGHIERRNNNEVVKKIGKIEVKGYRVREYRAKKKRTEAIREDRGARGVGKEMVSDRRNGGHG